MWAALQRGASACVQDNTCDMSSLLKRARSSSTLTIFTRIWWRAKKIQNCDLCTTHETIKKQNLSSGQNFDNHQLLTPEEYWMVGDQKNFQRRELGLPGKTQNVQLNLNFRQTLNKCFCLSMPHATLTVLLFAKSGNPSDRKLFFFNF